MENLAKATRLLYIPSETAIFNGQIQTKSIYNLVEYETLDYTQAKYNPTTKRTEPLKTTQFVIEKNTQLFGMYALNLLSMYLHNSGYQIMSPSVGSEFTLFKPYMEFVSPYDNKNYWIGWSQVDIDKTAQGYDFEVKSEVGNNVYFGTVYPHDENVITKSVLKKTFIKTTSTPNPTRFTKSFPLYTISQLKAKSGLNNLQLAEAYRQVFHIMPTSHETHVNSIQANVLIEDNTVTGEAYINGILHSEIPYTSLISSYAKPFPNFVTRWKLYNQQFTKAEDPFGSAWNKTMSPTSNQSLNLQEGDKVFYDTDTNTLTYPPNSKLVYDWECLPAQGKNEQTGVQVDLETMTVSLF